MIEMLLFAGAVGAGIAVQSAVGFAGGLVAMPMLVLFLPARTAVPAYSLTMLVLQALLALESRQHVQWRLVVKLLIGGMIGVPLGAYVLRHAPTEAIGLAISAVSLTLAATLMLATVRVGTATGPQIAAGLASGVLGGSMGTSGPPVALYGIARGWDKNTFRTTLLTYFAMMSIEANLVYLFLGMHSGHTLTLASAAVVPGCLIATGGIYVKNRVNERLFRWVVLAVIAAVSIAGMARCILHR